MAKLIKIGGKDYVSLSSTFFYEVMNKIHDGCHYDEEYVPSIVNRITEFSKQNKASVGTVLVPPQFIDWMKVEYDKYPMPWRHNYSKE